MKDLRALMQPGSVPPYLHNPDSARSTQARLCECLVRRTVWLLAAVAVVMAARGVL